MRHSISNLAVARIIDQRNNVVRLDMAFGVAPIVRAFSGDERKAIDIERPWRGATIRYVGNELSTFDLSVLIALLSISQKEQPKLINSKEVDGLTTFIPFKKGMKKSASKNLADEKQVVEFETSFARIRSEMGTSSNSPDANDAIRTSLLILQSLTVAVVLDNYNWAATHLIKESAGTKESLKIALSFRLANALFGEGNYGAIDMNIYRNLPRQGSARILYVHFASWFAARHGKREVALNTLVENTFRVKIDKITGEELRDKKFKIRQSLKKIQAVSAGAWSFSENARNVEVFRTRPSQPQRLTITAATPQNDESPAVIGGLMVLEAA